MVSPFTEASLLARCLIFCFIVLLYVLIIFFYPPPFLSCFSILGSDPDQRALLLAGSHDTISQLFSSLANHFSFKFLPLQSVGVCRCGCGLLVDRRRAFDFGREAFGVALQRTGRLGKVQATGSPSGVHPEVRPRW